MSCDLDGKEREKGYSFINGGYKTKKIWKHKNKNEEKETRKNAEKEVSATAKQEEKKKSDEGRGEKR